MLKKNKDYVEFTLQCTTVERTRDKDYREVCFNGYSDYDFPGVPMDVVCKDFNHKVVMISKSDFEALQRENEELKKKLHEFDPIPDYKELLKKLFSTEDVEKLEWTLNQICGGQDSVNGWMVTSKLWRRNYETLSKLVGFSSVEEIQDYLTNEAECDTLQEAVSKLKDQVKYTCDEWYSANSTNNSWKAAAECNSPKELIEKRETLEKEIKVYSRALKEWKEGTGCPSPSAAKSLIESGASWHHAYRDVKAANEKLTDDVKSWKNVTGYSTPEDYLHARINCATPFDYTSAWQAVTGCSCPKELSKKIVEWEKILTPHMSARDLCSAMSNAIDFDKRKDREIESAREALRASNLAMQKELKNNIDEWQKFTGCNTPEEAGGKISSLRDDISDRSTVIESYKRDIEKLQDRLKANKYTKLWITANGTLFSESDKTVDVLEAQIEEASKVISDWQKATGCDLPEDAETIIRHLRGLIDEHKEFAKIASNWMDRIVEG